MFLINNFSDMATALWEHLEITFLAVGLAILIGVPIGILISKKKSIAKPVLSVAGVFQTVPSLALFGLIIPFLGIGLLPSIAVLFLYALLPIITNTYIGITGIDVNLFEAARGMGMSKREILFKVELPLAVPMIMGGIKISSVTCAGTATIAALIGAGGLGRFIFRGIATGNNELVMMGAIPAALLAMFINSMFGIIERALKPLQSSSNVDWVHKLKKPILVMGVLIFMLPLGVSGVGHYNKWRSRAQTITIGHKNFTEQRILGQMYSLLIEKNTDLNTRVLEFGGTQIAFEALRSGEIDMYPEYTGTAYSSIFKETDVLPSDETYSFVNRRFKEKHGIEMLEPLGFNNTFVFLAKPEFMNKYNIKKISDLKKFSNQFEIASDNEFLDRPDGLPGVQETYGVEFKGIKGMDAGLLLTALNNDKVDISVGYGTDGRISKYGLKIIEDDKNYFPPYNVAPIIKTNFKKEYPDCFKLLNLLRGSLSDEEMQGLNLKVSEGKMNPRDVAEEYLKEVGLI